MQMEKRYFLALLMWMLSCLCLSAYPGSMSNPAGVTPGGAVTLTNKSISGVTNTLSAIPNSALSNPSFTLGVVPISLGDTVTTLSGLSLTNPAISTISNTGILTLPTSTDTLVGKATTDAFTNKTFDTASTGNSLKINGVSVTANSGTGAVCRVTGCVMITPTLGVAGATQVASSGSVSSYGLRADNTYTFSTAIGVISDGTFSSTVTTIGQGMRVNLTTQAASFTIPAINGYDMLDTVKGSGSTITVQSGHHSPDLTVGASNYGFWGEVSSGTNKYNLYMSGTAKNYLAGPLQVKSLSYISAAPTISSCGTSPSVDANSSNNSGTVTVGTVAAASCTITFATAFTTFNHCRVTSQGVVTSLAYSYTLSAITVTGTSLVGDVLDYACDGV